LGVEASLQRRAHNDIAEGILIFATAALLFYVSGWLFLKQDPKAWQAYPKAQNDTALAARSDCVVGALAFLAVLRDGQPAPLAHIAILNKAALARWQWAKKAAGLPQWQTCDP
jgi:high-affinity iron transporter